jgi:hypothetical protein
VTLLAVCALEVALQTELQEQRPPKVDPKKPRRALLSPTEAKCKWLQKKKKKRAAARGLVQKSRADCTVRNRSE